MTFQEYYQETVSRGMPDTAANKSLCQATWDTALCAASAACFERGKLLSPPEIHDAICRLHSWLDLAAYDTPTTPSSIP